MNRDEALRHLAEAIKLLNENQRMFSDFAERDRRQLERTIDAIHERIDDIHKILVELPESVLRRMDKQSLDARRKLLYVMERTDGSDLPPPPVGPEVETQHIPVHVSRKPLRERDDEETGVHIPLPGGGDVRVTAGTAKMFLKWGARVLWPALGFGGTYLWHWLWPLFHGR